MRSPSSPVQMRHCFREETMRQDSGRRRDCLRDEEIPHRLLTIAYTHTQACTWQRSEPGTSAHHTSMIGPYRLLDAFDEAVVQASTTREADRGMITVGQIFAIPDGGI